MPSHKLLWLFLSFALISCNDNSFSGGNKKKDPKQANLNDPNGSDANPNSEAGKSDCTDLDEQACKDKKKSDGNDKSFRTVDCTEKSVADCSKAVAEDIKKDGDNKSDIIVKGCAENKDNECKKIKDDYSKDGRIVKVRDQNGNSIGGDGEDGTSKDGNGGGGTSKDGDGGIGEDGGGTSKNKDGGISEGEGDTLKNNKGYLCLGGPGGRITVAKRTESAASSCMSQANSKPCVNDSKCGAEYHLQVHKCKCTKPSGIDYSRPCVRTNPLKPDAATVISECRLID